MIKSDQSSIRTMLFFVESLDALACVIIVSELGFVDGLVELRFGVPLSAFDDVHYGKNEKLSI